MSYPVCPVAGCHKKFKDQGFMTKHLEAEHPGFIASKMYRRRWATPDGFGEFTTAISYAEACERMKQVASVYKKKEEKKT